MTKSFTERLAIFAAEHEGTRTKRRKDKTLVAFLAIRSEVHEALAAGYSMRLIWECLHKEGRITTTYQTFAKHVQRHVKGKTQEVTAEKEKPPLSQAQAAAPAIGNKPVRKPEPIGFTFNPVPNLDELI